MSPKSKYEPVGGRPPGRRRGQGLVGKKAILVGTARKAEKVLKRTDSLVDKFNKHGGGGGLQGNVRERGARIKYLLKNEQLMGKGALRPKWVKSLGESLEAFLVNSNAYWEAAFRFAGKEKASPEVIQQLEARKTLEQVGMTQVCAKFI